MSDQPPVLEPVLSGSVILEVIFTITDPPVKLLRRLIPPVSLGGIRLDLSIMVLLFVVFISMTFVGGHADG